MQTRIDFKITNADLHKACTQNKYLKLMWIGGSMSVLNCKIGLFKKYESIAKDDIDTQIVGMWPISFHEYLRLKKPFIV